MKIYQFNINSEKEWVAANTVIQAIKTHSNITSIGLMEYEDEDDIEEVPESEWGKLFITHEDEEKEWNESFADAMKRIKEPDIIASTNY